MDLDQADERRGDLLERALDLTSLKHFEHVAVLDVPVAVEHDAALVALGHLANVVLEAAQRPDPASPHHRAVPDEANVAAAADGAARDVRAGDSADAGGLEGLAHLGHADCLLD